eukprot:3455778-Amphidinium_carterae.1
MHEERQVRFLKKRLKGKVKTSQKEVWHRTVAPLGESYLSSFVTCAGYAALFDIRTLRKD